MAVCFLHPKCKGHQACLGKLAYESTGQHMCAECKYIDLVADYEKTVAEYLQLCKERKYSEAEKIKQKKLIPMIDEQLRMLKGGE